MAVARKMSPLYGNRKRENRMEEERGITVSTMRMTIRMTIRRAGKYEY